MREIPAHSGLFTQNVMRRLGGSAEAVAKGDVVVHEVADRLHPRPAGLEMPERLPRELSELISVAIAAGGQEGQDFVRQILNRMLDCPGKHRIWSSIDLGDTIGPKRQSARWGDDPGEFVLKSIQIFNDRYAAIRPNKILTNQTTRKFGMAGERQKHGNRNITFNGYFKTEAD